MDVGQALELTDGLPLSNSIAKKVFHERVVAYSQEYECDKDHRNARQASRAEALLRMEQPIVAVEDFAYLNADACMKAGLSPNELNVADMKDGRYFVAGLVPIELHRSNDPTDFREPLPFPPDELKETEWFVVFAAISELIPGESTLCPFARVPDKIVDWKETTRMMKQRNAVDSLVSVLREMTDIAPFKAARRIVERELCKECVAQSLYKARDKAQFDLVAFDQTERPAFLPTGWKSSYWPAGDNLEAMQQWLGCALEALLHWQASFQGVEGKDIVSISMAQQARECAWLLARHARDSHGIKNVPQPLTDDSLSVVTQYLDRLRQAISEPASESPAVGNVSPDETEQDNKRFLKEPSREAFVAYRISRAIGMKQTEIAEQLTTEFRRPIAQGQVSRWLSEVSDFLVAGGVMPPMATAINGIASVDPKILDMGARQDGQTPRQRSKSTSDDE